MSRPLVLALLALLLLPAAASARAEPPPRIPAGWIGVAADGPLLDGAPERAAEWDLMKANRVGFVRVAFYWRELEPAPGALDFTRTDVVVRAAALRGLPVLPVVLGAPDWAAKDPGDLASPPATPSAYAALLTALVGRYGPRGSLWAQEPALPKLAIRRWQLWNEPNLPAYWSRQPFAKGYVALLRASRKALRAADRGARVILAGLPNRSWLALRAIYEAGGRGTFDAVALHPYTSKVGAIVRLVRFARSEMRRHRDARTPVWLTEISWPASLQHTPLEPAGFEVTETQQARRLRATLIALARVRRPLRVAKVVWYTWLSAEGASTPIWSGYSGLRRVRGGAVVTAPSLAVFKQTVGRLRRSF